MASAKEITNKDGVVQVYRDVPVQLRLSGRQYAGGRGAPAVPPPGRRQRVGDGGREPQELPRPGGQYPPV